MKNRTIKNLIVVFIGLLLPAFIHVNLFSMIETHSKNQKHVVAQPDSCTICMCDFEPQDSIKTLQKCSHKFHTDCINRWFLQKPDCPNCRGEDTEGKELKEQENKKIAAFMAAVDAKNLGLLRILLGQNPGLANHVVNTTLNVTILHYVVHKSYVEIALTLLEYGAHPNTKNFVGQTPLHIAADLGFVRMIHALCSKNNCNVDARDDAGDSPLHLACAAGWDYSAQALLMHRAYKNSVNTKDLQTPLHRAVLARKRKQKVVALLLKHRANIYALDKNYNTPMKYAVMAGDTALVHQILAHMHACKQQPLNRFHSPNSVHWTL